MERIERPRIINWTIVIAASTLSRTLLRASLLPQQLIWLGDAGIIVALVALIVAPRHGLSDKIKILLAILAVMFLVVLGVERSLLVETIKLGSPSMDFKFLHGWTLTAYGQQAAAQCGTKNPGDLISCTGSEAVPAIYGFSYIAAFLAYFISYLGVIFCIVAFLVRPRSMQPD